MMNVSNTTAATTSNAFSLVSDSPSKNTDGRANATQNEVLKQQQNLEFTTAHSKGYGSSFKSMLTDQIEKRSFKDALYGVYSMMGR